MRARTKAREIALQLLYQLEMISTDPAKTFDNYLAANPQEEETAVFARSLIDGVLARVPDLDALLKKYVKNWDVSRMAAIDRNILRLACFELIYMQIDRILLFPLIRLKH